MSDRFELLSASNALDVHEERRLNAHKTVEAFAGITSRRLWLKDTAKPYTDGYEIGVPLADPASHTLLSHQLSHILFQTNPQARALFITEYIKRISASLEKTGDGLSEDQLVAFERMMTSIVDALECHRVDSLWGLLYSGGYRFARERAQELVKPLEAVAHEAFATFLSVIEGGGDPPAGQFDRFRAYCVEAFRKTEKRGPTATLVVGKWLVTHLVSEIIREARKEAPQDEEAKLPDVDEQGQLNPEAGDKGDKKDDKDSDPGTDPEEAGGLSDKPEDAEGQSQDTASDQEIPEDVTPTEEGQGSNGRDLEDGPTNADPSNKSSSNSTKPGDQTPGSGKWEPPKTEASPKDRSDALKKLIDRMGDKKTPSRFEDIHDPPANEKGSAQQAAKMVEKALKADVTNNDTMRKSLDDAREEMEQQVERARNAFRQPVTHDDWLRKDAHAKVVFRDVRRRDVAGLVPTPLSTQDLMTVQKLRGIFNRVMGRRRLQLEESGIALDVQAYIERKVSGQEMPIFTHETRGQGFKPLLLIDRSGSMQGEKQAQSERACRIISRALKYPFVDLHVWGFQALADGQIDIVRIDPAVEVFDTAKSKIAGYTPLHLAIRVAHRFLERGSELKHVFAVTDGLPMFSRSDGHQFSTRQLLMMVRDEVRTANSRGIATTGAIVGTKHDFGRFSDGLPETTYDLGPDELKYMFGPPRFWKQIDPDNFGNDLVRLVATSFIDYLSRA